MLTDKGVSQVKEIILNTIPIFSSNKAKLKSTFTAKISALLLYQLYGRTQRI